MKNAFKLGAMALLLLGVASCDNDDAITPVQSNEILMDFKNLPQLSSDFVYEGWLITKNGPVSAGRFTADENGHPSISSFTSEKVSEATAYVLSVEPKSETGVDLASPSEVKLLAGDFSEGMAKISTADKRAIGTDLSTSKGTYLLATPTTATTEDELSGVWLLGLNLPTLNKGWVYEGWAVIDGKPYSTGRFTDETKPDDSSMYSGNGSAPKKPGEDFVMGNSLFPTNLQGATIVVSVEPNPDDSSAPFALKPLVAKVPTDAKDHTNYEFEQTIENIPSGIITK